MSLNPNQIFLYFTKLNLTIRNKLKRFHEIQNTPPKDNFELIKVVAIYDYLQKYKFSNKTSKLDNSKTSYQSSSFHQLCTLSELHKVHFRITKIVKINYKSLEGISNNMETILQFDILIKNNFSLYRSLII